MSSPVEEVEFPLAVYDSNRDVARPALEMFWSTSFATVGVVRNDVLPVLGVERDIRVAAAEDFDPTAWCGGLVGPRPTKKLMITEAL